MQCQHPGSESRESAADDLRRRALDFFVGVLLWVMTPILVLLHVMEWSAGRYDAALLAQVTVHAGTVLGILVSRKMTVRGWVAIGCLYFNAQLILVHYGPTFTAGLLFLAAVLLGHIFFGWRAVSAILTMVVLAFVVAGALFTYGGAPFYDPGVNDLTEVSTWARFSVVGVTVLATLAILLGQFHAGLERSARVAESALERERQERADKERHYEARRQAELAFAESQRQELIGRLAAGASHDLNNVLTAIMGHAELADLDLDSSDVEAVSEGLRQIGESARRASAMGRQLLSFSRQQHTQPRNVTLDELLHGLLPLLHRLLPSNIELTVAVAPELPPVFADPAQLEQVLMNLVVNARDALPDGGQVRVTAESAPDPAGQSGVQIDVTDTGVGIPDDVRQRMFEPFFTTKEGGRGTGLGLATVRAIIEECSGTVTVASEVGRGTTFTIWLPASSTAEEASPVTHSVAPASLVASGAHVLVADDDGAVRHLASRILEGAGYRVDTAQDGHEVIAKVGDTAYDLVVLDAVMPGPTGSKLVARLEQLRPDLLLLFSTGYDPGIFGPGFFAGGKRRLLAKPYRRTDLLAAVREVLEQRRERDAVGR